MSCNKNCSDDSCSEKCDSSCKNSNQSEPSETNAAGSEKIMTFDEFIKTINKSKEELVQMIIEKLNIDLDATFPSFLSMDIRASKVLLTENKIRSFVSPIVLNKDNWVPNQNISFIENDGSLFVEMIFSCKLGESPNNYFAAICCTTKGNYFNVEVRCMNYGG